MKMLLFSIVFLGSALYPCYGWASYFRADLPVSTPVVGDVFVLPVAVEPAQGQQYTASLTLSFPADLLEVTDFTFASSWIPVRVSEYDAVDNSQGLLVKTAGFPEGFLTSQPFGIITFRVKSAGEGVIRVAEDAFILNAVSDNTLESRFVLDIVTTELTPRDAAPSSLLEVDEIVEAPLEPSVEQKNLFDVLSAPAEKPVSSPFLSFLFVFGIGVALGLCILFIMLKIRKGRL